jgi:NADH:ubiquinone oxidoreductase subunit 2 (subunit N)
MTPREKADLSYIVVAAVAVALFIAGAAIYYGLHGFP